MGYIRTILSTKLKGIAGSYLGYLIYKADQELGSTL